MPFHQPRLRRMHDVLASHVERGSLSGLVALVAQGDEVHVEVLGSQAFGGKPMRRDSLFRIASLTKPMAAAAAMILVEQCKLRLDDPIEPWIPELANRRVMTSLASLEDTVPARRPITVRDLLTYRMGFGSVMAMPGTYPIQQLIAERKLGGDGPPRPALAPTTEAWLQGLASLPWMAQPGERWLYNTSGDVLGILIMRVSGQPLGAFMQEHLFGPLGMKDTAFHVPAQKRERLTTAYVGTNVYDAVEDSAWGDPPPFESAAGGLVSTIDDHHAFSRMMLNHGRHGREQVLARATVELMTADHLLPSHREGAEVFFGGFSSWGLGLAVDTARAEVYHTPGRFGWTGGLGTTAYTDPTEGLVGILLTQRLMDSPEPPRAFTDFWTLAYGALV